MKVEDVLGWLMNYLTRNEFLDNWIVSFLSLLAYRPFFLCVYVCVSHRQFSSALLLLILVANKEIITFCPFSQVKISFLTHLQNICSTAIRVLFIFFFTFFF